MAPLAGPRVARVYHRAYAAVLLIAWVDLGVQLRALLGASGIRPPEQRTAHTAAILLNHAGDRALMTAVVCGAAFTLAALVGLRPRAMIAGSIALYWCFAGPLQDFWQMPDDLLVLAGIAAVLLPEDRPAPWAHLFLKLVLVKLYVEPGLAKLLSPDKAWISGTAMSTFYEVVPLPTVLTPYLHFAPKLVHQLETWGTLFAECVVPFAAFGPRRLRLLAFAALSLLQIAIICAGNFGFLNLLSLSLHVCLLDDELFAFLSARRIATSRHGESRALPAFVLGWSAFTVILPLVASTPAGGRASEMARSLHVLTPFRMFDFVPAHRVQAEIQTFDGQVWTPAWLEYQPGDVARAPVDAMPLLPRMEFMLWFQAMMYPSQPLPPVRDAMDALCRSSHQDMASLFLSPLPARPKAVRLVYSQYEWVSPAERKDEHIWWHRTPVGESLPYQCGRGT